MSNESVEEWEQNIMAEIRQAEELSKTAVQLINALIELLIHGRQYVTRPRSRNDPAARHR